MKSFHRAFTVGLLSVIALAVVGRGVGMAAEVIKIGFVPPMTGDSAAEGALQIKSIKLALKEINAAGGVNGKKVDLVIVDNRSTNPGALAALQKVVEQEKVLALVGSVRSTQILAMSDTIKGYGIPTIIGGTNVNLTKQGNPWLFRVRPDDGIAAGAMVKFIKENTKFTKIGILNDVEAFGQGGGDLVEKYAKQYGLDMVKRERFKPQDKDYTPLLLSLKNAGAQVMIVYSPAPDTAVIQRQVSQLGSPFKYLGSPSSASKDSLNLAKEAAEGIWAVADAVPGQSKANKSYCNAYKKEYNEEPDMLSSWTYDGLHILVNAIKKAGENRDKIRQAVLATQGYEGVLGTFSFTPNGDGLNAVSIIQIEKGQPKLLKVVKVGTN
jgi:branched-chain amino acid transport system substrate-binding protein